MSNTPDGTCIAKTQGGKRCKNPRYIRGLCKGCYCKANREMSKDSTLEARLLKRKLILPRNSGRKSLTVMAAALAGK